MVKSDWGENTGWISRGCLEGLSEDGNRGMTDEKDPAVGRAAGRRNSHCKGSETGRNTAKEYCLGVKELDFFFFCFLMPHPQHMEVPRLGVESEL